MRRGSPRSHPFPYFQLFGVLLVGKVTTRGANSKTEWLQCLGRMPPGGIRCASTMGGLCLGGGEHQRERGVTALLAKSRETLAHDVEWWWKH